jgi:hypothetical protein
MGDVILMLVTFLAKLLSYIFICILFLAIPFLISGFLWFLYYYFFRGMRLPKRVVPPVPIKNKSMFLRLLILFPMRFVLDFFQRDPDAFPVHGLHIFSGEQGSGKTIAMIHFVDRLKKNYPMCNVRSNFSVDFSDGKISSIDDIVFTNNGVYGEVQMVDEIQNWFNSLESKNFPLEMIQEICQQRKQRKIICGTSQVFNRVAKPIREQTTYVYKPITIFGCLTIVGVYKPRLNEDGGIEKMTRSKLYFFVHDEYLRNCYDTYEKIERLNKKGFKDRDKQISSAPSLNIKVNDK